jgi:hypothetical protein
VTSTDENLRYHEARLLVLLAAFENGISGLTKLAKLDFLLRYPTMLERLMVRDGRALSPEASPTSSERLAVESPMIRYKYGPWDDLYYPLIGSLVGKGLADAERKGRMLKLQLTAEGADAAQRLLSDPAWNRLAGRVAVLRKHYNRSGNHLKERIYREFPEVLDRPHRVLIDVGPQ